MRSRELILSNHLASNYSNSLLITFLLIFMHYQNHLVPLYRSLILAGLTKIFFPYTVLICSFIKIILRCSSYNDLLSLLLISTPFSSCSNRSSFYFSILNLYSIIKIIFHSFSTYSVFSWVSIIEIILFQPFFLPRSYFPVFNLNFNIN